MTDFFITLPADIPLFSLILRIATRIRNPKALVISTGSQGSAPGTRTFLRSRIAGPRLGAADEASSLRPRGRSLRLVPSGVFGIRLRRATSVDLVVLSSPSHRFASLVETFREFSRAKRVQIASTRVRVSTSSKYMYLFIFQTTGFHSSTLLPSEPRTIHSSNRQHLDSTRGSNLSIEYVFCRRFQTDKSIVILNSFRFHFRSIHAVIYRMALRSPLPICRNRGMTRHDHHILQVFFTAP